MDARIKEAQDAKDKARQEKLNLELYNKIKKEAQDAIDRMNNYYSELCKNAKERKLIQAAREKASRNAWDFEAKSLEDNQVLRKSKFPTYPDSLGARIRDGILDFLGLDVR